MKTLFMTNALFVDFLYMLTEECEFFYSNGVGNAIFPLIFRVLSALFCLIHKSHFPLISRVLTALVFLIYKIESLF